MEQTRDSLNVLQVRGYFERAKYQPSTCAGVAWATKWCQSQLGESFDARDSLLTCRVRGCLLLWCVCVRVWVGVLVADTAMEWQWNWAKQLSTNTAKAASQLTSGQARLT